MDIDTVEQMDRRRFLYGLAGSGLATGNFAGDHSVEQVLVMFKCHLDVGFVDTQAAIIRKYFTRFYPQAIAIAESTRVDGQAQFVWTTGSWLLYRYLEQANARDRVRMEKAIARGDIAWHALPFTWQTELLDRSTITGCLGFSKALDGRFGRRTTGAKMTDVPGHSRGLIGPLAEGGVQFLDIGVNAASTPPDVPSVFVWKDARGASILVMYHRTEYGGVVRVPGSRLVVAVEVRDDNSGPHTPEEIRGIHSKLRAQFPKAAIRATDLTTIANAVKPYENALPVVTQEIGDTWIYGVPSDPLKVARFRELLRLRRRWIGSGKFALGDATDLGLLKHAALAAEHTWGTDTKTWLDFEHYTPAALRQMLNRPNYRTVTNSWVEKRADITAGVATLPAQLRAEAEEQFARLKPVRPDTSRLTAHAPGAPIEGVHFTIGLDAETGAIAKLTDKETKREWASRENPLALFTYQTLSQGDYDRFLASYITLHTDWAPKDFGKPNIQKFGAESGSWGTKLISCYSAEDEDAHRLVARMEVNAPSGKGTIAFPRELWMTLRASKTEPVARITFAWFGKDANRMPEALWLGFRPIAPRNDGWMLTKVGQQVSPFDVVPGGNRHMHAISRDVHYRDADGGLTIETLDAPVVALGERSPISFSKAQPDLSQGLHFCLFNNGWGTNYVQWFGEDMQFRFLIRAS
jgi:hypothetical protein